MTKHRNNADFRRRYSEKRGHFKRLFDLSVLGIVILIALAAWAADCSGTALCGETAGAFAGWFLVVIGFVPLLLYGFFGTCFGSVSAMIPTAAWHLAAVDLVYLVLLWAIVRWIARRHSSEFLLRAWHIALILFCWGVFQLTVFAASALWHHGGVREGTLTYLHQGETAEKSK